MDNIPQLHGRRLLGIFALPSWIVLGRDVLEDLHLGIWLMGLWPWLETGQGRLFVVFFACAWLFFLLLWPSTWPPLSWRIFRGWHASQTIVLTDEPRQTWFFPAGLSVSLQRGLETQAVLIYLHILSTKPTELIYIRLNLTDTTGLRIVCEHSEPLVVEKFETTAKMLEQKITTQELSKFQKGVSVNLEGYAKFRDGDKITQEQIRLTTIPNV